MKIEQSLWTAPTGWKFGAPSPELRPQLVIVFGAGERIADRAILGSLRDRYPEAYLFGCSTAGEIHARTVCDDSITATAVQFEKTAIRTARVVLDDFPNSREAGRELARQLNCPGLAHILVISDGVRVNGSELTKGLGDVAPSNVSITGGLSGDGARFQHTLVCDGDDCRSGTIVGVGLVGDRLRVNFSSGGGWSPFGPQRAITRSTANVLYELDGEPALSVYKRYLGDYAAQLPSSGLLFPLSVWANEGDEPVVRTILGVDESKGSMTFAGDVPEGQFARLMHTSIDALIEGASDAARQCAELIEKETETLALIFGCVGRKLILRTRVEEEVEAVADELGETAITGFYSYGEICPISQSSPATLHNQSMSITTLCEV